MRDDEIDELLRSAGQAHPGAPASAPSVLAGMRPGLRWARMVRRAQLTAGAGVMALLVVVGVVAIRDNGSEQLQVSASDGAGVDSPTPVPTVADLDPDDGAVVAPAPTAPDGESPTAAPDPTAEPDGPTPEPTPEPTPTSAPSAPPEPTATPTPAATPDPSAMPTTEPTAEPTPIPSATPAAQTEEIPTDGGTIEVMYTATEILMPLVVDPAPGYTFDIEKEEAHEVKVIFTGPTVIEVEIHLEDGALEISFE